jgi:hypothetical protein
MAITAPGLRLGHDRDPGHIDRTEGRRQVPAGLDNEDLVRRRVEQDTPAVSGGEVRQGRRGRDLRPARGRVRLEVEEVLAGAEPAGIGGAVAAGQSLQQVADEFGLAQFLQAEPREFPR